MEKIFHFIPSLNCGGAETLVRDYCIISKKKKVDMSILLFIKSQGSNNEKILKKNGINIVYIKGGLFLQEFCTNFSVEY